MSQNDPTEKQQSRQHLGTTRVSKKEFAPGGTRQTQVIGIGEGGFPDHTEEIRDIVFAKTQPDFDEEGWPTQRRYYR